MSNKKKTREAEQRAQAAEAEATALRNKAASDAEKNIKLTPEAQNVLTESGKDFTAARSGDVRNIGRVANFLGQQAESFKTASRVSPTGSAALATDVANPELLAMNAQKLNRQQAQDTALGVTALAADAENEAATRIGAFSGMDLSAKNALANFMFQNASLAAGNAGQAWQRYQFEKQQRGFLQNLALGAVGAAGSVFQGAFK